MQRYIILHSIILPHIRYQSVRSLSSSSARSKSSLDIDTGSSTFSSWHFAITPDKGGLLPESSRAAQYRAEEREEGGTSGVRSTTAAKWARIPGEPARAQIPSNAQPPKSRREPPDKDATAGADTAQPSRGRHEQTIHDALSKIVAIHIQQPHLAHPDTVPPAPETALSTDRLSESTDNMNRPKEVSPSSQKRTRPLPPLPPMVHHLILRRQFRLAVFHILNTPSLASSTKLIQRVAEMLEIRGAGKLAGKLRGSMAITSNYLLDVANHDNSAGSDGDDGMSRGIGESDGQGRMALGRDVKDEARWNGYWKIGPLPPIEFDDDYPKHGEAVSGLSEEPAGVRRGMSKGQTRQEAFTSHINAHLTFLLRQSALSKPFLTLGQIPRHSSTSKSPLSTHTTSLTAISEDHDPSDTTPTFPHPAPNLRQLREILRSIQTLERKHQFVPDRITANIILGCWLRCAQSPHPLSDPLRVRVDSKGDEWVSEKEDSQRIIGPKEIMALHKILRGVIERTVGELEDRYRRVAGLAERLEKLEPKDEVPTTWGLFGSSSGIPIPRKRPPSFAHPHIGNRDTVPTPETHAAVDRIKDLLAPLSVPQRGEISFVGHIKPLAETIKRALRRADDRTGVYEIVAWEKGVQARLREIRRIRAEIRKVIGLVSVDEGEGEVEREADGAKRHRHRGQHQGKSGASPGAGRRDQRGS